MKVKIGCLIQGIVVTRAEYLHIQTKYIIRNFICICDLCQWVSH